MEPLCGRQSEQSQGGKGLSFFFFFLEGKLRLTEAKYHKTGKCQRSSQRLRRLLSAGGPMTLLINS